MCGICHNGHESPTLQKDIALALIKSEYDEQEKEWAIEIREDQEKQKGFHFPFIGGDNGCRHRYLPTTEQDRKAMLDVIGVDTVEDLFTDIPKNVRFQGDLEIPDALSEPELLKWMRHLAKKNLSHDQVVSFLGAGVYEHHIPSVVQHLISRSEFYTADTPYQPEVSQGELQAMFEFQTMICELTGMDVANSSMYDGATAVAEAANLAVSGTGRKRFYCHKHSIQKRSRYCRPMLVEGDGRL